MVYPLTNLEKNIEINKNVNIKNKNKESKIGIIGLGYVGLPLVIRFSQEGFKVIGFDVDKSKIKSLNEGKSYIKHIKSKDISKANNNGFLATKDFKGIQDVDIIIICVPTPLGIHNEPDLSYIQNTLDAIKPFLKENKLIILESTTYPGTTEEILVTFIENIDPKTNESKLKFMVGENIFIGYSPEREDPGNKDYSTKNIPKVERCYKKMPRTYQSSI